MICNSVSYDEGASILLNGIEKIVVTLMNWMDGVDDGWFLPDPDFSGVRSMGPGVSMSLQELFENFTDVTLADVDTNSILDNDANRAIWG